VGSGQTNTFSGPSDDILKQFINQYLGAFSFGNPLDHDTISKTVKSIFPDNFGARSWLLNALETVVLLVQVTSSCPSNLQFSAMEAFYARGLTTVSTVHPLSKTEFKSAFAGTIAYPYAREIFMVFTSQQQPSTGPTNGPAWTFAPVNGDGTLIDCTPPYNFSPLGPISCLFDMLNFSIGKPKAIDLLSAWRGSVGKMQASLLSLEPSISKLGINRIINENLEALGSNPS
jgi:hypothetical protein